ncbi:MAG TPA: S46 family peptidase, partial [Gemmatimonadales bacterium]|nr:S46 family peptidase [Gemmatimonadales bacterium]
AAQQPATPSQGAGEYPGLETGKMWTFDQPPLEYWARRYSFRPTPEWLDHVRLAALRQPGCTASFVSGDGLIMTNHHCARACIEGVTRQGEDLLGNGFYARTREDERPCPNMWVDQLLSITDLTDSVNAAVPAGAAPARAAELRTATIRRLEERCTGGAPDLVCQMVPMYRGGQYKLYRFRRFSDVRLVFAPESDIAFFGGDPDNFTYPRHDLDVSFYRAYVNREPAHTEFFRWSRTGASEGDLVLVVGNPGSTGRLNTIAQLEYLRDVQYPVQLAQLARLISVYDSIGRASPERAARLRNTIFSLQNSQKAIGGYQSGLLDPQLMQRKREWESTFRSRVNADPTLRRQYGDAWDQIARIRSQMRSLDVRRRYHGFGAYGSRLLNLAGQILRWPVEMARPDSLRLEPFRDANRASLERAIGSATPIDTMVEIRLLTAYFTAMQAELPSNDPVLRAALQGRTPEAAARAMVSASQLLTAEQRRSLIAGQPAEALSRITAAAGAEPFLALARVIDPLERQLTQQWNALVESEDQQNERIARALLAVFGSSVAPDATFSLRISDGEVRRYPMNGTFAQPFTTFHGLYDRHYGFSGRSPWNLPERWIQRRDSLRLHTPLNAVSTNDIIGGNSGSPVLNRDGEVVGLIFDGNVEGLPARFLFTEARGRSVWVDARGIIEALRRIYDAGALADELAGPAR